MAKQTAQAGHNTLKLKHRTLDARPDTLDFRDRMFEPTLVEVPTRRPLDDYLKFRVPILDQGREGACTGFGLATVVNYLLRTRKVIPDRDEVSPRMLYNMARRYDEWPGEKYSGSSARGAMKGWHKHGVCSAKHWVYDRARETQDVDLFLKRYSDALRRPLGAYFRVNHKDIVAMHSAISEIDVLYATAQVHTGWDDVGEGGLIRWDDKEAIKGGHAFAMVAYDENGFWIQNSWAEDWGHNGFAQITYDDWLANGSDVWVARLGAPIVLRSRESVSRGVGAAAQGTRSYVFCDLRPHIISLGNDGQLRTDGTYGTSEEDVGEIFEHISRRLSEANAPKHLLLYGHGGLTAEDSAIQKIADLRAPLAAAGVYPISLIWKTDFWTTLKNILEDGIKRRRPEGFLDSTKDFMLDRLDDLLEPIARAVGGKAQWDEMKENAALASQDHGGLLFVLKQLLALKDKHPSLQVHLAAHSAGSILIGGLANAMASSSLTVNSCSLWAPACTIDFFRKNYLPAIKSGALERLAVFALTDQFEKDDNCANIYHKSILYLVSHAFEEVPRQPWMGRDPGKKSKQLGEPILGMEKWIAAELRPDERKWDLVLAPNTEVEGTRAASRATSHGDFDDDNVTLQATLGRILNRDGIHATFGKGRLRSARSNLDRRASLMGVTPI
jgi:hypothetical protein